MKRLAIARNLAGGDRRSIGKSEEVVAEVLADARLFDSLFDCMLHDDPLVRMRAADAVEKITAMRPDFLMRHKAKLIGKVAMIDQQEVRWHVAQLIPRLQLTKNERSRVVELMEEYLKDNSSIVRTFAMQALAEMAMGDSRLRPSIIKRLKQLTEEGTPAMKNRGRKLLAKLEDERTS